MFPFSSVNISLFISSLAEPYSAKHMVTDWSREIVRRRLSVKPSDTAWHRIQCEPLWLSLSVVS